jgi:patched 1 protein
MVTVLTFFCICCVGLQYVRIETDIVKLWVAEGGRLNEELRFFKSVQDKYGNREWTDYDEKHFLRDPIDAKLSQIREDESSNSGYQVLIQTAENPEENLLTKEGLLRHVELLNYIIGLQISHYGVYVR